MKISLEKIKQKAIESSGKNHIKNDYFEYFKNGVDFAEKEITDKLIEFSETIDNPEIKQSFINFIK